MADEIRTTATSGQSIYALLRNAAGNIFDLLSEAFVTYSSANYQRYIITLDEQGETGVYLGSVPAGVASGMYSVQFKAQSGSPLGLLLALAFGDAAESDATLGALAYLAFGTPTPAHSLVLDGTGGEFLLDDPVYLGSDTTIQLTPFTESTNTAGWTYSLYLCSLPSAPVLLQRDGPSLTLTESGGVFTAVFTAAEMTPATTEGLGEGIYWLALWRTNAGFVECLACGPVRVKKLPGLPADE